MTDTETPVQAPDAFFFNFGAMIDEGGAELLEEIANPKTGFVLVPVGKYRATITYTELKVSGAGNPVIHATYTIDAPEEWAGKTVRDYITFTPDMSAKAANFLIKKMNTLGISPDVLHTNPTPEQISHMILGRTAIIETEHRAGSGAAAGKVYCNVKWTNADHGGALPAIAPKPTASGITGGVPTPGPAITIPAAPVIRPAAVTPAPAAPKAPTPGVPNIPAGL